ncbi:MAG TPA: transcriptional repressor [Ruminiclostridium sp.]|nr:transcriptional repressor [Ruminiclostridium sp.]
MAGNEHFRQLLKSGNLKSTKHRNAILEALEKNDVPLTAEELYLHLKEDGVSISLSTVYRILETLVERNLAARFNLPDENKAVYELKHDQHRHHLLCVKCRKLLPVDGCPLEAYEKLLEDRFGFTVKGHQLEVFGYCADCSEKRDSK